MDGCMGVWAGGLVDGWMYGCVLEGPRIHKASEQIRWRRAGGGWSMKIRLWRFWILHGGRESIKKHALGVQDALDRRKCLGRSRVDEKATLDVLGTR